MPSNGQTSAAGVWYVAPEGGAEVEAVSPDDKARRAYPPPRQPYDGYGLLTVTPTDVRALRPHWSTGRARAWLAEQEWALQEMIRYQAARWLEHRLTETTGRLLRQHAGATRMPFLQQMSSADAAAYLRGGMPNTISTSPAGMPIFDTGATVDEPLA